MLGVTLGVSLLYAFRSAGRSGMDGGDERKLSESISSRFKIETVLDEWDATVSLNKGGCFVEDRIDFLQNQILEKGIEGEDLVKIIDGMSKRRQTDAVDWLIENGTNQIFVGKAGERARKVMPLVKDSSLRERLLFEAGYRFSGVGLKEYISGLAVPQDQARFLTGYCCGIAESEPLRGLGEFHELKPEKVSFMGLLEIVQRFPEDAPFEQAGMRYGDDFTKGNSLAKGVRRELLKRWAKFHPEKAGKFVMDNQKLVAVDQLGHVLGVWMESALDKAEAWVLALPAGAYKDQGCEAFIGHWRKVGSLPKAWEWVARIGDFDRKVKLATEVFKEWEKKDQAAAVKAWEELFPPAR